MRIKYVVPYPYEEGQALRAEQIDLGLLGPGTSVEFVAVRNAATVVDCYYEDLLFEMYIVEAALRSEDEGFDAVVMDTVSDSGLYALRSRLTIPVLGPGLVSYAVALMLGRRFSILTMWDEWRHLYEKNLDTYHLRSHCASVRAVGERPDLEHLLSGKDPEIFTRLLRTARAAVEEDGADTILLGSTTMHHAAALLRAGLDVPVVDPGPVAVKMAETLVALGLGHSKRAFPSPTTIQDEKFFSLVGIDGRGRAAPS